MSTGVFPTGIFPVGIYPMGIFPSGVQSTTGQSLDDLDFPLTVEVSRKTYTAVIDQ
jgi:hypothetical protein